MDNEIYYSKSQILKVAESLRPIAGNGITDAFIKGIEGVEGINEPDFLDVWFANRTLEIKEYYERIREASNPYQVPDNSIEVWYRTPKE